VGTIERKGLGNLDKSSATAVDQPNLGQATSKKEKGESEKGKDSFQRADFSIFSLYVSQRNKTGVYQSLNGWKMSLRQIPKAFPAVGNGLLN